MSFHPPPEDEASVPRRTNLSPPLSQLSSTFSVSRSKSNSPKGSPSHVQKPVELSRRQRKISFQGDKKTDAKKGKLPSLSPKLLRSGRKKQNQNSPNTDSTFSPSALTFEEREGEEEEEEEEPTTPSYDPFSIHTSPSEQVIRSMNINTNIHTRYSSDSDEGGFLSASSSMLEMKQLALKKVALPSVGYGKSGPICYRVGMKSMLLRKWTDGYWLHVFPAKIVVFDSLEDMDKWKDLMDKEMLGATDAIEQQQSGNHGRGRNNHESDDESILSSLTTATSANKKAMKSLVKASINFDSTGVLRKKMKKLEDKNRKKLNAITGASSSVSSVSRNQKTKVGDCNDDVARLPITYIMEEVRSKYYDLNEPLM